MKILGLMSALLWLGAAMAGGAEAWQKAAGAKGGLGAGAWLGLVWLPSAGDEFGVGEKRSGADVSRERSVGGSEAFSFVAGGGRARSALAAPMSARVFPGATEGLVFGQASELVALLYPERGPPAGANRFGIRAVCFSTNGVL